jgi:D-alanine-D-alanine ligase
VRDRSELRSQCEHLLARYRQPVLVETFLPGWEFTVGILGTGDSSYALGVMEIQLQEEAEPEVYSYTNKKYYERRVHFSLADQGRRRSSFSGASRAHLRNVGLDTDGPVLC